MVRWFSSGITTDQEWRMARQDIGSTFGFIPAAAKSLLNLDPKDVEDHAKSWWNDITGQGQAVDDIINPPSAASIYARGIKTYRVKNPTLAQ